jgi:hypothetical protein
MYQLPDLKIPAAPTDQAGQRRSCRRAIDNYADRQRLVKELRELELEGLELEPTTRRVSFDTN